MLELKCGACYLRSGSQACLDGTRGSVLQQIECWVNDPSSPPIYWLNGLAGTGKSAIAWTIADKFSKASLFCSRDPNDPDRGKAQLIIIALASQLALKDSKFLSEFKKEVSSDVTNCTQKYQMSRLIINPIKKSGIENPVIVIDGLDECGDEETISNILTIIGDSADDMRNLDLKFLITSRPETRIYHYLRQAVSKGNVRTFSLHEVGSSEVNEDMQLFFKHELLKHNPSRGRMNDWPSAGALNLLSQRTAGLFSYASEIVRSINHHFETSRDQLDLQWLLDNISLDSLYTPIMDSAKNDSRLSNLDNPRSILGAVALAPSPITPSTIAKLLGIGLREVLHHLQKFEALFIVKDDDSPIQPLHKSVSTFLTNPSKSDQWFYICPRTHHKKFFVECLKLIIEMKKGRKFCPVVTMPREKNEKSINAALLYACGSLHKHVTSGMLTDYTPPLRFELEAVSQPMTDGPPKVRGPGNNRFQGALKGFWHLDKILKR